MFNKSIIPDKYPIYNNRLCLDCLLVL